MGLTFENNLAETIQDLTNLEATQINDETFYHESTEKGAITIKLMSDSMLEEDIQQLVEQDNILNQKEQEQLINQSFTNVLKAVGKYIPQQRLNEVFPNIQLDNLDQYDYHQSKLKVYILAAEAYNTLKETVRGDETGGFTTPAATLTQGNESTIYANVSEKRLILVSEVSTDVKEKFNLIDNTAVSAEEKEIIEKNVESIITHELLHQLDIGEKFVEPIMESIVEWYAASISDKTNEKYVTDDRITQGYPLEVQALSILIEGLFQEGITEETLNKAFLGGDTDALKELSTKLISRYGEENYTKIAKFRFRKLNDYLNFVKNLEKDKPSQLGAFLKEYS